MTDKRIVIYMLSITLIVAAVLLLFNRTSVNEIEKPNDIASQTEDDPGTTGLSSVAEGDKLGEVKNNANVEFTNISLTEAQEFEAINRAIVNNYYQSETAIEKQNAIDEARDVGLPYYLDWEIELTAYCHPDSLDLDTYSDKTMWIYEQRSALCEGYSPSSEPFYEVNSHSEYVKIIESTVAFQKKEELLDQFINGDLSDINSVKEYLKDAKTPIELRSLLTLYQEIVEGEDGIHNLWSIDKILDIPIGVSSAKIQAGAFELLNCQKFGCSASTLVAHEICASNGTCLPNYTMEDIIYRTSSPQELELMQQFLQLLTTE